MHGNSPAGLSQSPAVEARTGDVDGTGEVVDLADDLLRRAIAENEQREDAAYRRLARAVCSDEAAIDVDEHLRRVLAVVQK